MLGFFPIYYDVIYPRLVHFPIPIIVVEGPYEFGGVDLKEGDYIIDAGANIGVFSLYAAKKIGSQGKVFSFEPMEEARMIIESSAKINDVSNVIETQIQAVGDRIGNIEFKFQIESVGGSSPTTSGTPVIVPLTTIDTFVTTRKIKKIDFIKMDIEGAECEALLGASETIRKFKPRLSICTYHNPKHPQEIHTIIKNIRNDYTFIHTSHKIYAW
jgi:FkbM family methyltransferase